MTERTAPTDTVLKKTLVIDSQDNVCVALTKITADEECIVQNGEKQQSLKALAEIDFGHKMAITDIEKDEPVLKYGEIIGRATEKISAGDWIHVHNMYCERGLKK